MATPSQFFLINKNQFFSNKNRARHRVGNAFERSEMRGPQNGDSAGDSLEGQA